MRRGNSAYSYEALLCALRLQRISWQRTLAWREQRIHKAEVTFN
jgi:hypothetical protein